MILTCPRCATRYVVGEEQVGPQGRKVKCTSCGEVWRGLAPTWEIAVAPPQGQPPPLQASPEPTEPLAELPDFETPPLRSRPKAKGGARVLWVGLALTMAAAGAAAVVFRHEVVRQWPGAARAYSAVGLPLS